jgi:hypothetical protein
MISILRRTPTSFLIVAIYVLLIAFATVVVNHPM